MRLAVVLALLCAAAPRLGRADAPAEEPAGPGVAWVEGLAPAAARAELEAMEPGAWTLVTADELAARDAPPTPPPSTRAAFTEYQMANNLGCLERLDAIGRGTEADVGGPPSEVGPAMLLRAACLFGAQREAEADALLRRIAIAELPTGGGAREGLSPDLLGRLAEIEAEVDSRRHPVLRVEGRPAHGALEVDGRVRCERLPCEATLPAGEHVVVLRALGHATQRARVQLREDTTLALAAPRASPEEAEAQLSDARPAPEDRVWRAALTRAYDAERLLVLQRDEGPVRARLHDADGALVARARAANLGDALRGALRMPTELGADAPPLRRNPWLWAGIGAAVVAGVVAAVLLTRPPQRDIVLFPETTP